MDTIRKEEFQFAPGTVMYKGNDLGASVGSISITKEVSVFESFADSNSIEPRMAVVTGIMMKISMRLMDVDASMDLFLDESGQLNRTVIGSDPDKNKGELIITTSENGKTITYKFPNAVLAPNYKYIVNDESNNIVAVEFNAGGASGIYMEKI
ncbi:MAG: hypothetical protein KOO69_07430 [Victivallales bacterium]|nr:hypothetical protein [Victivallales bacterium]